MRIERVDEKTVKCFLSNEELEEYDIDYKDFILRSDKAREIVQEIIEQAEEEVGYKPPKFAFDLQIMMLPDQGLILTFSDRDAEARESDQFIECLKEMKRILQRTREKIAAGTDSGEQSRTGKPAPGKRRGIRLRNSRSAAPALQCLCSPELAGLWNMPPCCPPT